MLIRSISIRNVFGFLTRSSLFFFGFHRLESNETGPHRVVPNKKNANFITEFYRVSPWPAVSSVMPFHFSWNVSSSEARGGRRRRRGPAQKWPPKFIFVIFPFPAVMTSRFFFLLFWFFFAASAGCCRSAARQEPHRRIEKTFEKCVARESFFFFFDAGVVRLLFVCFFFCFGRQRRGVGVAAAYRPLPVAAIHLPILFTGF